MALQRICDPMLPELSRVFGASLSEASQVISFFAIAYGLMQLFYGPVGDRFGKCRVVMLATIGCSVGSLLSALSADLPFLVAVRVGTALAAAAIIPLSLVGVFFGLLITGSPLSFPSMLGVIALAVAIAAAIAGGLWQRGQYLAADGRAACFEWH